MYKRQVLSDAYVPIVMDADAVNLAARYPYLKGYFTENIILTPHVLEFSRLTEKPVEEIKEDPLAAAREFSCLLYTSSDLERACDRRRCKTVLERDLLEGH